MGGGGGAEDPKDLYVVECRVSFVGITIMIWESILPPPKKKVPIERAQGRGLRIRDSRVQGLGFLPCRRACSWAFIFCRPQFIPPLSAPNLRSNIAHKTRILGFRV